MRNAIEVAAYIRVNDLSMTSVNQLVDMPYGIQCAAVPPIGILFQLQVGLPSRGVPGVLWVFFGFFRGFQRGARLSSQWLTGFPPLTAPAVKISAAGSS